MNRYTNNPNQPFRLGIGFCPLRNEATEASSSQPAPASRAIADAIEKLSQETFQANMQAIEADPRFLRDPRKYIADYLRNRDNTESCINGYDDVMQELGLKYLKKDLRFADVREELLRGA